MLERLQSLLKQKEGELANVQVITTHSHTMSSAIFCLWSPFLFQSLVSTLERSRAAMTEELAKLASANEELKLQAESVDPLKNRLVVRDTYHSPSSSSPPPSSLPPSSSSPPSSLFLLLLSPSLFFFT